MVSVLIIMNVIGFDEMPASLLHLRDKYSRRQKAVSGSAVG
jgi:hypothetical protein